MVLPRRATCRPRASSTSRRTTPSTSTGSRCGTAAALHGRLRPQGRQPEVSHPDDPDAIRRSALRRRSVPGRPRAVAAVRQGGLHLRLPGRARPLDVGRDVRQHAAAQSRPRKGPQDIDESSDTYDTIDWLLKNVAEPQRQGRAVGHLVPRLLHRGRHDRRPPGAQGRLAAGADRRLVHRRRLAPQRRPVPAPCLQLHGRLRPAAARADPEAPDPDFDHGTPDGYDFFLRLGPLANADARYFKGEAPSGTR